MTENYDQTWRYVQLRPFDYSIQSADGEIVLSGLDDEILAEHICYTHNVWVEGY